MLPRFVVKFPLWTVLNVPIAIILVLSSGLIAYLSFQNGTNAVNDLASHLLTETAARVNQRLDSYLATPFLINEINLDTLRLGQPDMAKSETIQRHFVAETVRFETVAAITFANEDREYIGTARQVLGADLLLAESSEQTEYTLTTYETNPQGERGEVLSTFPDYDPRIRPWYQAAVTAGQSTWTPIFVWSNNRGIGLDAVTPVYAAGGELVGVLDVSLLLSGISEFLQQALVRNETTVFIVDEAGLLVATSNSTQPYLERDGELERLEALSSTDQVVQFTTQNIVGKFGSWSAIESNQQVGFSVGGEKWLVQIVPYQNANLRWWIVAVVPEDTYAASIHDHNRLTVLLIAISLLGSIILMSLVSRWITRPVLQLSQASQAFAAGNWSRRLMLNRRDELGELATSFNQMADQLQQSTASLQASEAQLRAIFENTSDAILVANRELHVTSNLAVLSMFGYKSLDDLIGLSVLNYIAPDERSRIKDYIRRRSQGEAAPVVYETRGYKQDGSEFDMEVRISSYRQNDELYSIATLRDITERKQAEQALRESEERFRTIIEAAPVGIGFSRQGINLFANSKYTQMFGYQSIEELKGRPLLEQVAPQYRDQIADRVRRRAAGEIVPNDYEVMGLRRDGSQFPYYVWVSYVDFSDGPANVGFFVDITERKEQEVKLREAERFARSTLDALSAQIAILDEYSTVLWVNNAWFRFASKNPDCLNSAGIGTHYLRFLEGVGSESESSATASAVHAAIQHILNGEIDTFSTEYLCHTPEEKRWFILRLTRFAGEGPTRIVVALENITEQVLSAQHLAEQKYQLIERVKELNCLYNHARLMEQPGISLEALCQGTVDLMPYAWQYPEVTCARLTTETGIYITSNFKEANWYQTSDVIVGHDHFGRLEVYYLENKPEASEGPFLYEERLLLDELARRLGRKIEAIQAEAALQQAYDTLEERVISRTEQLQAALERVEAILNSSVDGILLANPDFTIQRTNAAFDTLFACNEDDYSNQYLRELLLDASDDATIHQIQAQLVAGENLYKEIRARRCDGTIFDAEISIGHIRDEGLVCVIRDITERKQTEVALRHALDKEKELGELKTRFVSMASHEFRTPLATILATTETLTAYRQKLTDDQITQRLSKIKEQVDHLKGIMEDILLLAQMQSRRLQYNPVIMDIDALCRSVLDEFQSRPDVSHQLNYTCSGKITEVSLDRKLMRQVISNLVPNAIKYSPQNSGIKVNLQYKEPMVILEVADEGIGIPEADLAHLFEPFHRAANVGTISGTGLGLVITKESVELHGGTITVKSQLGVGTVFTIHIPISREGGKSDGDNSGN